jgi:spore maturation protein A
MCTFLAINTSSVQLILPATVVALMGAASNQIFLTTIVATGLSTIAAIIAVKTLEKMNRFNVDRDKQDD